MKNSNFYDMNRGRRVHRHSGPKRSQREEKRIDEKIQQEKFEEKRINLILAFKFMYFTTIIIEYFVLKWWLK